MTKEQWHDAQIKGISIKMLWGAACMVLSVIGSCIWLTMQITEYKVNVANELESIKSVNEQQARQLNAHETLLKDHDRYIYSQQNKKE
jgi:hypothetical protein